MKKKIKNIKICCYLDLNFNANSLNETDLLNQMRIFIDFWKLETENSLLHVFSFLHKLSFENSFYFQPILGCQTSFLVSKIENNFWKQIVKGKSSYQIYPISLTREQLMVRKSRKPPSQTKWKGTTPHQQFQFHFVSFCLTNMFTFYAFVQGCNNDNNNKA